MTSTPFDFLYVCTLEVGRNKKIFATCASSLLRAFGHTAAKLTYTRLVLPNPLPNIQNDMPPISSPNVPERTLMSPEGV
jgi:hypothetical protein